MDAFNIYLTGVGGQGIGLISEVILRAADHAGKQVKGVDTHGLAQRGGIVVSQIRIGRQLHSPLIPARKADLVIALERHEALRGVNAALRDGGTLVYYDAVWQPLSVRLGQAEEVVGDMLDTACARRGIQATRVFDPDLGEARMQNMVLLRYIDQYGLIPGIDTGQYRQAMEDLMSGSMLDRNLALFNRRE